MNNKLKYSLISTGMKLRKILLTYQTGNNQALNVQVTSSKGNKNQYSNKCEVVTIFILIMRTWRGSWKNSFKWYHESMIFIQYSIKFSQTEKQFDIMSQWKPSFMDFFSIVPTVWRRVLVASLIDIQVTNNTVQELRIGRIIMHITDTFIFNWWFNIPFWQVK